MPGLVIVNVPPWTSSGESFLVRARSPRSLIDAGEAEDVLLVGVLDDGDDQAPVEGHGDADVHVAVVDDVVLVHRRVDDRELAQAGDRPPAR